MRHCLVLFAVALLALGCERYRTRAQGPGPYPRQPAGRANPSQPRPTLAIDSPTPPAPPKLADEMPLVPPRPPEPEAVRQAVAPPLPPKPPVVEKEPVTPAGGFAQLPTRNPQPAAQTGTPPAAPAAATNFAAIKKISKTLAGKLATLNTYEAHFTRRENLNGAPGKLEEVILQYRAKPMAVYMKNISAAGKDREILYNPSQQGQKIHVVVGEGDTLFFKAGTKVPSQSPDSPSVRSKSRHSIRESGVANSGYKFVAAVARIEEGKAPADSLKRAGRIQRDDLPGIALEGIEQTIRKGDEDGVPNGGVRHWFFDAQADSPSLGLPVLVILYDASGKELEYYRYTHFNKEAKLTDANFDPSRMGKKKRR